MLETPSFSECAEGAGFEKLKSVRVSETKYNRIWLRYRDDFKTQKACSESQKSVRTYLQVKSIRKDPQAHSMSSLEN